MEAVSTREPMTDSAGGRSVWTVRWRDHFRELSPPGGPQPLPPTVRLVRWFGFVMFGVMIVAAITGDPPPALHGSGLVTLAAVIGLVVALPASVPRAELPPFRRARSLVLLGASAVALTAVQPDGAGVIGVYMVVVVAALRLRLIGALVLAGVTVGAETAVLAGAGDPAGQIVGLLTSIVPWLLVMRLVRNLRIGRDRAERLVGELEESRGAEAEAAAVAERSRVARDLHDVLAHSLSALALQLEGARMLARDRSADPEVVDSLERAHHLAASGLQEARRAVAALRGDELPGPEGLQALADAFCEHSEAGCALRVEGDPRLLTSQARLAVYRTAQEALTNVRKHAAAARVDIRLAYAKAGTELEVADHGPGAPVAVGAPAAEGSGYGLTGMRERAELLGGTLDAGPTDDGFRVRLWLPA